MASPSRPGAAVAATAHVHQARLYTRNAGDFDAVGHLVEIVPV